VDGVPMAHFREVSGLSASVSVIEHKALKPGGIPTVIKLPGPPSYSDLVLKRGKTSDTGWWDWLKEVQQGKIDSAKRNASIVLYHYDGGEKARWNILNAWPSKVSMSNFQAGGSEIAMEECTIVHEGLELA